MRHLHCFWTAYALILIQAFGIGAFGTTPAALIAYAVIDAANFLTCYYRARAIRNRQIIARLEAASPGRK